MRAEKIRFLFAIGEAPGEEPETHCSFLKLSVQVTRLLFSKPADGLLGEGLQQLLLGDL